MRVLLLLLIFAVSGPAIGDTLRVAQFHTRLDRDGPGLLLRDILKEDGATLAAARLIARADPDVILLHGFDYDLDLKALSAFAAMIRTEGSTYTEFFALRPNAGLATGIDMDGDGRVGRGRDAQGYGRFVGQGGMAVLSKLPLDTAAVRDFSSLLWRDLPGAVLPVTQAGTPFPSPEAQAIQRLSSAGHWDLPVILPNGTRLHLLAFHATPPVFDGPEDLNGLRNRDEIRFWSLYLDGKLPEPPPTEPVVLIGDSNLDPDRGDGFRDAMRALLDHPRLQDPLRAAGITANWSANGIENMRVDYILPDIGLNVLDAGLEWFRPEDLVDEGKWRPSRHALLWVDLEIGAARP